LKKKIIIESHRAEDTRRVGRLIGQSIKPGAVIALSGELGSGKTQFVKGLARGLGVDRDCHVSSPSFVLINEYPGKIPLYHSTSIG
jgi:tRNA threonylcarbamoyladenosine biosynthesis protein TsaE